MSPARMPLAALTLVLLGVPAAAPAAAQDSIRWRGALPIDGRGVDAISAAMPGAGPVRVALSGTMTCSIDGSEIDALSRWVGTVRDDATGPFVRLPAGARLVSTDPVAHRYVFELPEGTVAPVALDITPIASRYLITPSEARSSLTGAIEIEVLDPPPLAGMAGLAGPPAAASMLPLALVAGGMAGLPIVLAFGAWRRRRQRAHPEKALLARAERARSSIRRESDALGLAFVEVATQGERLLDTARAAVHHLEQARAAARRTAHLESAADRRAEIVAQQADALARLEQIVRRLEDTAGRLAAHRAAHARVKNLDSTVSDLAGELETALSADTEAHST
jgi:hypothetical protein